MMGRLIIYSARPITVCFPQTPIISYTYLHYRQISSSRRFTKNMYTLCLPCALVTAAIEYVSSCLYGIPCSLARVPVRGFPERYWKCLQGLRLYEVMVKFENLSIWVSSNKTIRHTFSGQSFKCCRIVTCIQGDCNRRSAEMLTHQRLSHFVNRSYNTRVWMLTLVKITFIIDPSSALMSRTWKCSSNKQRK
jgi:hypothetical protein